MKLIRNLLLLKAFVLAVILSVNVKVDAGVLTRTPTMTSTARFTPTSTLSITSTPIATQTPAPTTSVQKAYMPVILKPLIFEAQYEFPKLLLVSNPLLANATYSLWFDCPNAGPIQTYADSDSGVLTVYWGWPFAFSDCLVDIYEGQASGSLLQSGWVIIPQWFAVGGLGLTPAP